MSDLSRIMLGLTVTVLPGLCGCSRNDDEPEHRQIEGTVEKIDLESGSVALRFFHRKSNSEQVLDGRITDTTEVLINGQQATPKDILLKERVKVTGYKKGSGVNAEIVAVKVEIERAEWIETGSTRKAEHSE